VGAAGGWGDLIWLWYHVRGNNCILLGLTLEGSYIVFVHGPHGPSHMGLTLYSNKNSKVINLRFVTGEKLVGSLLVNLVKIKAVDCMTSCVDRLCPKIVSLIDVERHVASLLDMRYIPYFSQT
jgi:hypothetical protein